MTSKGVRLNFYHWYKNLPTVIAKKNSVTTSNFLHVFSTAPSDLQLCVVEFKSLAPSVRYLTSKYTMTLKPGLGSLKVIRTDMDRSATCVFLLKFNSNHEPISYRFRDKRRFQSKIANFPTPVYLTPPPKGFPLGFGIGTRGGKTRMMGLSDG